MRLLIVRHGDPDYEHDTLTEKGWREAELLSERLSKLPVKEFYVSPLGRAKDTASLTLQKMNREANTILSKANDLAISDTGIELKTNIEKVREQIQNIE